MPDPGTDEVEDVLMPDERWLVCLLGSGRPVKVAVKVPSPVEAEHEPGFGPEGSGEQGDAHQDD